MNETRPHDHQGSVAGAVGARAQEQPLDDWLGEISDEDWSENATDRTGRRHATSASQVPPVAEGDLWREPTADPTSPAAPISAAEVRRAVIERRRLFAGLVFVLVLGVAAAIAVLLLRGGHEAPTTPVGEPTTTTTPAAGESSPSPTPTTPSTSPSTTTPTTTTSPGAASTFTLPEGTKLRLGQGDPAVVKELQQALAAAGYDPGPADGTFGQGTEKAVVAFQQAKGLSPDGVVGPETASALNGVVAGGASTFTLPEGTKLRLGQGDPAVVKELQQALAAAGYDPGPADGTFGQGTEKAVVAFQQAKGLSPDGVVGPETASALNGAVAGG